jgi:hypothetical protein
MPTVNRKKVWSHPRALVTAIVVVALGLTACSGGGSDDVSSSTSTTAPPTTAAPVTTIAGGSDLCPWFHGSTTSLASSGPTAPAFLIDATAGARGCLDVVTLTFRTRGDGTAPGYSVAYRDLAKDPLTEPASEGDQSTQGDQSNGDQSTSDQSNSDQSTDGDPSTTTAPPTTRPPTVIDVPGAAHIVVSVAPAASTDASVTDGDPSTYPGNLSLEYGDHHHLVIVRELPDTNAFGLETVNWVIGLDSVRPFRVDRAANPPRVTILIG